MERIGNYLVERAPFGPHEQITFRHAECDCLVSVIPALGGIVNRLRLWTGKGSLDVIHGYADYEDYQANKHQYRSAWLFPFPNRVAGGKYAHEGKEYRLPVNEPELGNALHGLVYDEGFELMGFMQGHAENFEIKLRHSLKPTEYYPHDEVEFIVNLSLETNRLFIDAGVWPSALVPHGIGWHPYFTLGADSIDDYSIQMPLSERVVLDERNIPTGEREDVHLLNDCRFLKGVELDDCFALASTDGDETKHDVSLYNEKFRLTMRHLPIFHGAGYEYVQLFTPPHRQSVAIEPMTCNIDALNNKEGLRGIDMEYEEEERNVNFSITLELVS